VSEDRLNEVGLRYIVSGGRFYDNWRHVCRVLDEERPGVVITGECPVGKGGADGLAKRWAALRGVPLVGVYAHFNYFGGRAGPIRDEWMFDLMRPYKLIAFPGDKGTANAIRAAEKREVLVRDERTPTSEGGE
jgi:hypothetical protein